ncbi:hypothetical protein [Acaryochloris marina]|uniref:hypothetical protein n=1 Tax=Acaryochloris marina TaxID=155978 RepID=UPI001BAE98E9|nr:hypothetical protein [Acaryochloris marina]
MVESPTSGEIAHGCHHKDRQSQTLYPVQQTSYISPLDSAVLPLDCNGSEPATLLAAVPLNSH